MTLAARLDTVAYKAYVGFFICQAALTGSRMADQPTNKQKRRVKNPDSFRERALKASQSSARPSRVGRLKQLLAQVVKPVIKPLAKALALAFQWKPLALLISGLRLISKFIFPAYFRNSWRELKLVTWPSWKQSRSLTFAVLVFAVVFGAAIAIVDFGLDKLFRNILLK